MQTSLHPLPTFFIVGAPKTGTTSLHRYLNQHRQVYMSPVKEPCFFASEVRLKYFSQEFQPAATRRERQLREYLGGPMSATDPGGIVADWEDYLRLFENVEGETAIGESSVCYLWSPTASVNIQARIPEAKIVMILRDPAERAFSQYLQYAANGLVKRSFRRQIECGARNSRREFDTLYPFLEYGLYYRQVKAYLDLFASGNVKICFYEEAWKNPSRFLHAIFEFLNVDSEFRAEVSRRDLERRAPRMLATHYALRKSGITPRLKALVPDTIWKGLRPALFKSPDSLRMDPDDRKYLCDYYREDVGKLSSMLDRDLGAWLRS